MEGLWAKNPVLVKRCSHIWGEKKDVGVTLDMDTECLRVDHPCVTSEKCSNQMKIESEQGVGMREGEEPKQQQWAKDLIKLTAKAE